MLWNSIESSRSSHRIFGEHLAATVIAAADTVPTMPLQRIRGGLSPRALRRVREYVQAHLDETISVEALAGIARLSKYHFARAFKQSEGVTPHDYVVQSRVRRARELIAGTNLPLSQIALACGFADESHLARRFREHVDITPSSYRWSMR
jgi:transcriptional regulator GlxA family with amidase domain